MLNQKKCFTKLVLILVQISVGSFLSYNQLFQSTTESPMNARIVDGTPASITDFPYQVSIRLTMPKLNFHMKHVCGGSIISENMILTAAHCLVDFRKSGDGRGLLPVEYYTIVAGSSSVSGNDNFTQIFKVNKSVTHCKFKDDFANKYDMAILFTDKPIQPSDAVKVIKLNTNEEKPGTLCTISGFGFKFKGGIVAEELQMTKVRLVKAWVCGFFFVDNYYPSKICLRGLRGHGDACNGDSGGPLTCNGILVGVASMASCGEGYPALYTKVSSYIDFIEQRECN